MVVAACLGLGSLLLLSEPARRPDSTSVPLELTEGGGAIVAVSLNGRPYRLAVETGSPGVRLSSQAMRALGLRSAGVAHGTPSSGWTRSGSAACVRGLAVGRGEGFARLAVDGVLGLDAYRDYTLTVDYPAARLSLSRDTSGWSWTWAA